MSATEVKATEQDHYDMSSREIMARCTSSQLTIFLVRAIRCDLELRHQMTLKKPVPALQSPLMARRYLENVHLLAGIGLLSSLEAGSAFLL